MPNWIISMRTSEAGAFGGGGAHHMHQPLLPPPPDLVTEWKRPRCVYIRLGFLEHSQDAVNRNLLKEVHKLTWSTHYYSSHSRFFFFFVNKSYSVFHTAVGTSLNPCFPLRQQAQRRDCQAWLNFWCSLGKAKEVTLMDHSHTWNGARED